MTEDEVMEQIEKIKAMAGDDEVAHATEDDLYRNLLQSIADGKCEHPIRCATLALTTRDIEFERWCA